MAGQARWLGVGRAYSRTGWTPTVPSGRLVAIASLAFAFGFLVQPTGDNQKAHYALVRALADGRPTVDEVRTNPNLRTIDVTEHGGHLYAAKSPGLALFSLPAYLAARAGRGRHRRETRRASSGRSTSGRRCSRPSCCLLLVWRLGDDVEPGRGIAAAVALGAATLVLPFATLFFSHLLAAALAFGAFAVLWSERKRAPRLIARGGRRACSSGLRRDARRTRPRSPRSCSASTRCCAWPGDFARARSRSPRRSRSASRRRCSSTGGRFGSPFRSPYEGWHARASRAASGVRVRAAHRALVRSSSCSTRPGSSCSPQESRARSSCSAAAGRRPS